MSQKRGATPIRMMANALAAVGPIVTLTCSPPSRSPRECHSESDQPDGGAGFQPAQDPKATTLRILNAVQVGTLHHRSRLSEGHSSPRSEGGVLGARRLPRRPPDRTPLSQTPQDRGTAQAPGRATRRYSNGHILSVLANLKIPSWRRRLSRLTTSIEADHHHVRRMSPQKARKSTSIHWYRC